jgi:hypothetical protein
MTNDVSHEFQAENVRLMASKKLTAKLGTKKAMIARLVNVLAMKLKLTNSLANTLATKKTKIDAKMIHASELVIVKTASKKDLKNMMSLKKLVPLKKMLTTCTNSKRLTL